MSKHMRWAAAALGTALLLALAGFALAHRVRVSTPSMELIPFVVHGDSMMPLLRSGQRVLVNPHGAPERSRIVVLIGKTKHRSLIKKVAAVGGDHFAVKKAGGGKVVLEVNGQVYQRIGGQPLALDGDESLRLERLAQHYQGVLPEGSYLVLGERPESIDSRSFGLVGREDILGVVQSGTESR